MYKSKLQELCHKNGWTLPEYTPEKNGADHNPKFSASVFVNGLNFASPDFFKTSKEAQNDAARLAFLQLTGSSTPNIDLNSAAAPKNNVLTGTQETSQTPALAVKVTAEHGDLRHMYKSRLQNYAQKKNISFPIYSCEREGPIHASRFKARVIVDGKTFEADEYCNTVKEAEHAAAKVALKSLALDDIGEDDLSVYKNLLQELAQKEGFNLPQYSTCTNGEPHMPVFVSTVEIGGQNFRGPPSKTKKQAEMGAAKVAYNCLKENGCGQICKPQYPNAQGHEAQEVAFPHVLLNAALDGEQNASLKSPSIIDQSATYKDLHASNHLLAQSSDVNLMIDGGSSPASVFEGKSPGHLPSAISSHEEGSSSSSRSSGCETSLALKAKIEELTGGPMASNAIRVYPNLPNLTIPPGYTVLTESDNNWVAVTLDHTPGNK